MIGRRVAVLLAIALATASVQASDLAQPPLMKMELGIRLRDSGKLDVSFNGIPVRATESAHMTCPPPPQSCAGLVGIMAAATAASLVLIYAVSRNR